MPKYTVENLINVLKDIESDDITRREAADKLGVTPRTVNRLMEKHKVDRPRGKSAIAREMAQKTRDIRKDAAVLAKKGQISLEKAAKMASCSTRTIYRYMKSLP